MIIPSRMFKYDLKDALDRGVNINETGKCIDCLSMTGRCPENLPDEALTGKMEGFRKCTIENKYQLVYRVGDKALYLFRYKTN